MNFVGQDQSTFVKENYMLSCERTTVMTTVSSSNKLSAPPCVYLFKRKGTRLKLSPPTKTKGQWAEKGSYCLRNLLQYVENISTHPVAYSHRKELSLKGYFLIIIGFVSR